MASDVSQALRAELRTHTETPQRSWPVVALVPAPNLGNPKACQEGTGGTQPAGKLRSRALSSPHILPPETDLDLESGFCRARERGEQAEIVRGGTSSKLVVPEFQGQRQRGLFQQLMQLWTGSLPVEGGVGHLTQAPVRGGDLESEPQPCPPRACCAGRTFCHSDSAQGPDAT